MSEGHSWYRAGHLPFDPTRSSHGGGPKPPASTPAREGYITDTAVLGSLPAPMDRTGVRSMEDWTAAYPWRGTLNFLVQLHWQWRDVPLAYVVGGVLPLLATLTNPAFCLPGARPTYSNLYTVLVGETGSARKGQVLWLAENVLGQVAPTRHMANPGSDAGILRALAEDSNVTLMVDPEIVGLYAAMKNRQGPLSNARQELCALFDAENRRAKRLNTERLVVESPRLSLLGAATPGALAENLDPGDIHNGLANRVMHVFARRERWVPDRPIPPELLMHLQYRFARILACCPGSAVMDDDARSYYEWWTARMDAWAENHPAARRIPVIAKKVALLYALDLYVDAAGPTGTPSGPVVVTREALDPALRWAALVARSNVLLEGSLTATPHQRYRRMVLDYLADDAARGVPWTRLGMLTEHTGTTTLDLRKTLDTLVEESRIEVDERRKGGASYRLKVAPVEERTSERDPEPTPSKPPKAPPQARWGKSVEPGEGGDATATLFPGSRAPTSYSDLEDDTTATATAASGDDFDFSASDSPYYDDGMGQDADVDWWDSE